MCLAQSVLQYFPTLLRLCFKGSPPASVQAGLLISPHTKTWAATSCMTHVAPKNVHFNSAPARRDGSISCGHRENLLEDVQHLWHTKGSSEALGKTSRWRILTAFIVGQSEWQYHLYPHKCPVPFTPDLGLVYWWMFLLGTHIDPHPMRAAQFKQFMSP